MKDLRRHRVHLAILLLGLVLLATAERRLAYLDFNSDPGARFENNDKPDGDEIINRLVFVDTAVELRAPEAGEACHAAPLPSNARPLALIAVRLSESRAPPFSPLSHV
jgi:hypothetical protein